MKRPIKRKSTAPASKAPASKKRKSEVWEDESSDFVVQCPAKPTTQTNAVNGVYRDRDDPGVSELAIDFTVQPESKWTDLKTYRNVKYHDQLFSAGSYVLVNRTDPPPSPPAENAPAEQVLAYQRKNMWVGRIQQIRGKEDGSRVYLRVFWLYWPEELSMGTQPYHGHSELVLSNAADIVDATTISSSAEISHWNEEDDDADERALNALFWRQTLDVSKLGKKGSNSLSKLRRHCTCGKEYNPDTSMYRCSAPGCSIWNHSGCLHHELMENLWNRFQTNSLRQYLDEKARALETEKAEKKESLGETIRVGAFKMMDRMLHTIERGSEGVSDEDIKPSLKEIEATSQKSPGKKRGRPSLVSLTKDERLQAVIATTDDVPGTALVVAKVRLHPDKESTNREPEEWVMKLDCLKCGEPLD